jgi:hypothetical protein
MPPGDWLCELAIVLAMLSDTRESLSITAAVAADLRNLGHLSKGRSKLSVI